MSEAEVPEKDRSLRRVARPRPGPTGFGRR